MANGKEMKEGGKEGSQRFACSTDILERIEGDPIKLLSPSRQHLCMLVSDNDHENQRPGVAAPSLPLSSAHPGKRDSAR